MGSKNERNNKEIPKKSVDKNLFRPRLISEKPRVKEIKTIKPIYFEKSVFINRQKLCKFDIQLSNALSISEPKSNENIKIGFFENLHEKSIAPKSNEYVNNQHFHIHNEHSSAEVCEKLKIQMEKYRISWLEGCDKINVSRDNIIEETLAQIEFLDLHKVSIIRN